MTLDSDPAQTALQKHIDTFVNNFFVNGARNHIHKATQAAPWLNVGIMEKTNSESFYSSQLFAGMNVVGGSAYSLGHGFVHGYLADSAEAAQIKRAITSLNALGAEEIIFYHDESLRGLSLASELELELQFTPVTLLEWLIRLIENAPQQIQPLNMDIAVQLPCSWESGDGKNSQLQKLFDLIGVRRVERNYDFNDRVCCGARGYFGLLTGHTYNDSDYSESLNRMNIEDAQLAGATHVVTTCPYCYAALAEATKEKGMTPIQIEGLVSLALFNEPLPEGLIHL